MSNRLSKESSPYLLQHAHNPVDWYPWGTEAFERAIKEDKPVLVSIGYAACHWCHVMEKESFENEEVAAIMNKHFINIKVDREERPDVDHIYMDAVQAISGSGGWPLNVFLTPDKKPFYGGTYFPPRRAFNRSSWTEVLTSIANSYRHKRDEIEVHAINLTEHLQTSNAFGLNSSAVSFSKEKIDEAFLNIMKQADKEWGGFGLAPKFPQTFTINFLLSYSHLTQNNEALKQALLSLDKMLQGGIYDHIGGGFARYSTDTEWLVPHFEKMLYDNALIVSTLSDAYAFTKNETYKKVIEETLDFIERELTHNDGGFYSAVDADSEGEEGKFYVWEYDYVKTVLGNEADIFCTYFDITPGGNWEGKNIPRVKKHFKDFAKENGIDKELLEKIIAAGKEELLLKRDKRIRPILDDKILLNWNALMNIAYSKAFAVTGNEKYKAVAIKNMAFMLTSFGKNFENLHHSCKEGNAKHPAFLDDYAFLIAALIELAQAAFDFTYLDKAAQLIDVVLQNYVDNLGPFFFYTASGQQDILMRKKEVYDGATPSGNSVMAHNLYRLSVLLDKPGWRQKAEEMINSIKETVVNHPTSFGVWLSLLYEIINGTSEIAIVGSEYERLASELHRLYIPQKIMMASANSNHKFSLIADKKDEGKTHLFLCKNYACQKPVTTLSELLSLLSAK